MFPGVMSHDTLIVLKKDALENKMVIAKMTYRIPSSGVKLEMEQFQNNHWRITAAHPKVKHKAVIGKNVEPEVFKMFLTRLAINELPLEHISSFKKILEL